MANTYTQIYLHAIFAVSGRVCVISSERREELQKYITGIVTGKRQKLAARRLWRVFRFAFACGTRCQLHPISRSITVESHSNKNVSNSSSGITSRLMSITFLDRWNKSSY
jgi:hypothetical protein